MLFTNEYTILKSRDGGKDIIIKPGKINAFEPIEGKFTASSYARILDTETLKQVCQLEVGKIIDGVGVAAEIATPKKRKAK